MIVGVHPLAGFDKVLHYRVPAALAGSVVVGSLVRMPIRGGVRLGLVGEVGPPANFPVERLKLLTDLVFPFPALTPEMLQLARWMARYYACGVDAIIEAMIPVAVRRGAAVKQARLLAVARPLREADLERLTARAPQQARLYRFLVEQVRPQPRGLVLRRLGIGASSVTGLVRMGVLREESRRIERVAYADAHAGGELVAALPHALNAEQQAAVDQLAKDLGTGAFSVSLLLGVTGSGKTEVYLRAIDDALRAGGGVVFLVPEVALTPQTVARLRSRLEAIAGGERCVVWHSHLSEGERGTVI